MGRKRKIQTVTVEDEPPADTQVVEPPSDAPVTQQLTEHTVALGTESTSNTPHNDEQILENNDLDVDVRRRSKAKMAWVWKLPKNQRIPVEMNEHFQPVDEGTFSRFCGVLARAQVPLNYKRWKEVPKSMRNSQYEFLKTKFLFPHNKTSTSFVSSTMAKSWRGLKCEIKGSNFDKDKTREANVQNVPHDIQRDEWEFLVNYWLSEPGKKLVKKNKECRARQHITHTTGSMSFARKKHKMKKAAGTTKVGMIEFHEASHIRKDGTYIDPDVPTQVANALLVIFERSQAPSFDPERGEAEIMSEVCGPERSGRVRGYGLGPTPTTIFKHRASSSTNNQHLVEENKKLSPEQKTELDNAREELKATQDLVSTLKNELTATKNELARTKLEHDAEFSKIWARLGEKN